MTDFYALLKQSIIDRGIRNISDRQEVYAQARRAVVKQLWDYRPPLAADEIDIRVGAYDTAVERIEADLQTAFANGETMRPKTQKEPRRPPPTPVRPDGRDGATGFTDWPNESRSNATRMERVASARTLPSPTADAARDEEPDDERAYAPDDADEGYQPRGQGVRWAKRGAYERAESEAEPRGGGWPDWLGTPEQAKVRLAAIAVGALVIVLVGVTAYVLGARSNGGVTLPIGVRREVSDAATAARIPTDKVTVAQTVPVFDGRDPTVFATTPDNPVGFDSGGGFARVSSSTSAPGVKVTIGPGLAARLAGQNVRVVIVARSSLESGAAGMRFAYQSGLAISHWQTANLAPDYAAVGMEWRVPAMQTSPTGDFLLIEPGIPGDGTGVDIKSITIDVLAS